MCLILYEPGDIVIMKNLTFKDNNLHDIRVNGRPSLIIHKNNNAFYFLTITKKPDQLDDTIKYYEIVKDKFNKLPVEKSYINLENIYKSKNQTLVPIGSVFDYKLDKILKHLVFYQLGVKKDEYYEELVKMKALPTLNIKITESKKSD